MNGVNPKKTPAGGGLVYSTEHGRMCPACRKPLAGCLCKKAKPPPKSDGIVRVRLETKGRKGKGVTVIAGVPLDAEALEKFGRQLKQRCGSGGTVKDGTIEIQGDHRDLVMEELGKQGWTVRKAGG
jgi:translation initiation factor 1